MPELYTGPRERVHHERLLRLMKLPCLPLPVLLLATLPLHAESQLEREIQQLSEQRDRAAATAMVPINRNYQAGLQQLLKRSVDLRDLDANAKIIELLRGLNTGAEGANMGPPGQTALSGRIEALLTGSTWLHNGTYHYTFTKNGSIILAEPHPRGKYHIDGKTGAVTLHWEGGMHEEALQYDERTNTITHKSGGTFVPVK